MAPSTSAAGFGERFSQERPLDGPHLAFDLGAEAARLLGEAPWRAHGQNAITLAKYPDLRLVLTVLRAGASMALREPGERVTLQLLTGRVRVQAGQTSLELGPGQLVALDRAMAHEVEALADAALLLTISRNPGR